MVVARENGIANQVRPPAMKPQTPCKVGTRISRALLSDCSETRQKNGVMRKSSVCWLSGCGFKIYLDVGVDTYASNVHTKYFAARAITL